MAVCGSHLVVDDGCRGGSEGDKVNYTCILIVAIYLIAPLVIVLMAAVERHGA